MCICRAGRSDPIFIAPEASIVSAIRTNTYDHVRRAGVGPTYLQPQVIMPGRLGKFAFQIDF